jgi:hypothetical protein
MQGYDIVKSQSGIVVPKSERESVDRVKTGGIQGQDNERT